MKVQSINSNNKSQTFGMRNITIHKSANDLTNVLKVVIGNHKEIENLGGKNTDLHVFANEAKDKLTLALKRDIKIAQLPKERTFLQKLFGKNPSPETKTKALLFNSKEIPVEHSNKKNPALDNILSENIMDAIEDGCTNLDLREIAPASITILE